MPILYALISRGKTVLAEYTSNTGNFPTVTRVLLSKISSEDTKMSYIYDKHVFHYIVDNGIIFLCMSDESTKRRLAFAFLEDIKKIWREKFVQVEGTAHAFSLNDAFSPVLNQKIDFYNNSPNADTLGRVQAQLDEVKDVMIQNIDRVMESGEKIELLVDKTDRLNQQSFKFEKSARGLKNAMYYRKIRNYCILFLIVCFVIFFIVAMVCGIKFDKC